MRKAILFFLCFVSIISLNAQSKNNGLDTVKQGIRNIGNVFKKAGTVRFTINNIDNTNNDLLLLKNNIQQTINVKKIEDSFEQNTATFKILYKGKASDLWNNLSANTKQAFTLNQMNDSIVSLNYRYAKTTAQHSGATKNQNISNNNSSVKPLTDSSNLSKGAALLFKNIKTKLTALQKNKIADSLEFKLSKDEKQFIADDEAADYPFDAIIYPTDLNKDGREEIFIVFGNSYTSGMTGSSIVLFIADKNGSYKKNLNFPGLLPDALATNNSGYPDLLIGGLGMEFPVWRWNGKEYDYFREVKDADYTKLKTTNIEDLSKAYTASLK
ncbi:MAG TPA: hypothetical protein VGC75_06325 [Candidatus Nitrosocosmicus sp.]